MYMCLLKVHVALSCLITSKYSILFCDLNVGLWISGHAHLFLRQTSHSFKIQCSLATSWFGSCGFIRSWIFFRGRNLSICNREKIWTWKMCPLADILWCIYLARVRKKNTPMICVPWACFALTRKKFFCFGHGWTMPLTRRREKWSHGCKM